MTFPTVCGQLIAKVNLQNTLKSPNCPVSRAEAKNDEKKTNFFGINEEIAH
jgi:hypothetical protein